MKMNPIFEIDFYKVGHINQYPQGTRNVWTNWTPRSSRTLMTQGEGVINFGLSRFIQKWLLEEFNEGFFNVPLVQVLSQYREVMMATLGPSNVRTDHIEALHTLGYLPIRIYALPEGEMVPLGVPTLVIMATDERFFWLPNYLETLLSSELWKASTSATTARRYRCIALAAARAAGEMDMGFVDWQCHDFSMRGMSGHDDLVMSGLGHLTQFSGTDTVPAILAAHHYYGATYGVGGSVPATEHSVMCAGSQEGEFETFKRLITEVYPTGIVSIVSDTWDLWRVLTEYIPRLRDVILARDGKIVIRPDSGDPVRILCGDDTASGPANEGVLRLLARALGTSASPNGRYPMINKAGVIYGDSITPDRFEQILSQTIRMGLSPFNVVVGVGSYTYEYVTRDTFGYAMKATAVLNAAGGVVPIWKKPVTDDGSKFSARGILAVYEGDKGYVLKEEASLNELNNCAFEVVFEDSQQMVVPTMTEVRARARKGL